MARKTAAKTRRVSKRSKTARSKPARAKSSRARSTKAATSKSRWSQRVTEGSDALDLRQGVFALKDPRRIAASLKRSAERSKRRKAEPYRSAMSMLTFYVNRGGKTLPDAQKHVLQRAKDELRKQFGRSARPPPGSRRRARKARAKP